MRQNNSKAPAIQSLIEKSSRKKSNCDPKTIAFLETQGAREKEIRFCEKAAKELKKIEEIGHYANVASGSYKAKILIMPGQDEKEKIQRHLNNRRLIKV